MATPGYVFRDSGTTPPAVDEHQGYQQQTVNSGQLYSNPHRSIEAQGQTEEKIPNEQQGEPEPHHLYPQPVSEKTVILPKQSFTADSHELAERDTEPKGAVQLPHQELSGAGLRDLGWHRAEVDIPDPLIGGISNGRLFAIIRRFNKDVFAVQSVSMETARSLDLNEAWDDEYTTEKLTLHLQRLYLSIFLGLASFGKQISRLRSWRETRRTAAFCFVYFLSWLFDMLFPLLLGTLAVILASESAREALFPSAPRALVDISTGALQTPPAGQLGTCDSLTGAPEKQKGEAIEEEAAKFVENLRHVFQRAVGMHQEDKHDGDPLEGKIPKPARKAVRAVKGAKSAPGHTTEHDEQTLEPMEGMIWDKAKPENLAPLMQFIPHAVGEVVDNWERAANAISPTPPFPRNSFLRLEAVILPLFLGSFFVSSYMVYKGTGLAVGFAIFGDPLLTPALEWLDLRYPKWKELLEPKNNILRGVPTNSQLALTLLRIGEVNKSPLPPIPSSNADDPDKQSYIDLDELPLEASRADKQRAVEPPPEKEGHREGQTGTGDKAEGEPKHGRLSRISRFFKGNTKATVQTKLAADHVLAAAGSDKAKGHLGVLPKPQNLIYAGPSDFKARLDGKKGWLYITEDTDPVVAFTTNDPRQASSREDLKPDVQIRIADIKKLKRATAFASKPAEAAADWDNDRKLLGSVEIEDEKEKVWRFTALPERDELFNRLIAIGKQRWENL